jgi:hypothetical protein
VRTTRCRSGSRRADHGSRLSWIPGDLLLFRCHICHINPHTTPIHSRASGIIPRYCIVMHRLLQFYPYILFSFFSLIIRKTYMIIHLVCGNISTKMKRSCCPCTAGILPFRCQEFIGYKVFFQQFDIFKGDFLFTNSSFTKDLISW